MKIINENSKNIKKMYLIIFTFLCVLLIFFIFQKKMIKLNYNKKIKNINYLQTMNYSDNSINMKAIKVIAHRGRCLDEPENSLDAIQSSINLKVDYAEIDVQETKDGVVVLMHDKNLKRLTGLNKTVNELTYNQIEKLNIGSPYAHKYQIERIPTLKQVIKKSKGKINLIIEIKPYGNTDDLTKKVVNIIEEDNFVNECMIHSLSYKALLNVKKLNSNIVIGYIVTRPTDKLLSLNVDFYSIEQDLITQKLASDIHKSNRKVYVWTVDDKNSMNNIINLNVDGIITDKPEFLINKKKSHVDIL